ncbi:glutathione S-transferase family protein [Paraburkholderia sp. BR14374]|uniref:glutathione S-transferase family protein n=1 Tax=Paraburkholderia sp. BR14374 TaxID=3237007 RepID=UPI0034CE9430
MKLYSSVGPNPRLVRMFAAEKGIDLDVQNIDIYAGDNRLPPFLSKNVTGTTPVLELPDGQTIAETIAICVYLETAFPDTTRLLGNNPEESAQAMMWWRRVDLQLVQPMTTGFRGAEGHDMFRDRVRCFPTVANAYKKMAQEGLEWFNTQLADARQFIAGSQLTVADLLLYCFIEFGALVGQGPAPELQHLANWRDRISERESASIPWLKV